MPPPLTLHPQVKQALTTGQPVVALESTVITHGLPAPDNIDIAHQIEAAVRAGGAVPATIALLAGRVTVGLTAEQIDTLGRAEQVRKCSRRDLALVMSRREHGATTVAATMIIAAWAGLKIFATGGIGGVHRGHPFDASADLAELARSPVAVVCSGPKAILDLPLTLESLESKGVPLLGYQTDELPGFYSRQSGLPIDLRVDTPAQAAAIIHTQLTSGLGGLMLTVPVPASAEWPASEARAVINQALTDATRAGISGKAVTPYLLKRVNELSAGQAQQANVALLLNNARVAAQVAQALTDLTYA